MQRNMCTCKCRGCGKNGGTDLEEMRVIGSPTITGGRLKKTCIRDGEWQGRFGEGGRMLANAEGMKTGVLPAKNTKTNPFRGSKIIGRSDCERCSHALKQ